MPFPYKAEFKVETKQNFLRTGLILLWLNIEIAPKSTKTETFNSLLFNEVWSNRWIENCWLVPSHLVWEHCKTQTAQRRDDWVWTSWNCARRCNLRNEYIRQNFTRLINSKLQNFAETNQNFVKTGLIWLNIAIAPKSMTTKKFHLLHFYKIVVLWMLFQYFFSGRSSLYRWHEDIFAFIGADLLFWSAKAFTC